MAVETFLYDLTTKKWSVPTFPLLDGDRTLVLAFGSPAFLDQPQALKELRRAYPKAQLLGCSSAGEIAGTTVRDNVLSVAVSRFDKTTLATAMVEVSDASQSLAAGQSLARKLDRPGLKGVLVLSEGLKVNGSQLVKGMNSVLPESVVVTGGLSGDGTAFKRTWVCLGDRIQSGMVAAVGFYGDHVVISHGSKGGWDKFGPERVVTRSEANVLYELDGKPALSLYKEYLGDKAGELPASGLLFPLAMRATLKDEKFLVRTLLAVDHEKNSMTFAGDVPKGYLVQLMKADFDRLINGASLAAQSAKSMVTTSANGGGTLAVAISCVGRRLVLGDRIEEEVEAVMDVLPKGAHVTGFYSYGEISPYATGHCDLHNQTMTLTVLSESPTALVKPAAARAAPAAVKAAPKVSSAVELEELDFSPPPVAVKPSPAPAAAAGMKLSTFSYDLIAKKWSAPTFPTMDSDRTLVLVFGAPSFVDQPQALKDLRRAYPKAQLLGCSSAGEIVGTTVRDNALSVAVARFEKTTLLTAMVEVSDASQSLAAGQQLARKLDKPGLKGVLVLSEGLKVNGSQLVKGMNSVLPESVVVTGGLSGDGTAFKRTWVCLGDRIQSGMVAAVGFYGDYVVISHGSKGGWDKFGPERVVTRSEANVLYELDGKPALSLYKEYLGDKAGELPASGLLFPLAMRATLKDEKFLVRTLLAVDHEKNSMTFAGDVPKGHLVQLMKADFDRLIEGASQAAQSARSVSASVTGGALAVAISCVGRRLVLGDRTEEEVEAVMDVLPKGAQVTGFYSYGEISPYATGHCDLHNQTMTLTVLSESLTPLVKPTAAGAAPAVAPVPRATPAKTPSLPLPAAPGMRLSTFSYDLNAKKWSASTFPTMDSDRTLVLVFGAPSFLDQPQALKDLRRAYPKAQLLGCSSAGEIVGTTVRDNALSVAVARFEKTTLLTAMVEVSDASQSLAAGQQLARKLDKPGLRGVLVLSEGLKVNGSQLVKGMNSVLPESVVVTGGLSGDGTAFKRTWVCLGDRIQSGMVAAVGFYGDHVVISHGSKGGWDKFGPERVVTRSEANVLYELDGKPALSLYKEYLGDKAGELPASGLLFPLAMRATLKDEKFLVRTLLAVDHEKNSMTFAGDVPKGHLVQLMKADFERLIEGASQAAQSARSVSAPVTGGALAVAISCVGRRLVLGDRTEEEVEAVMDVLPKGAQVTGFYSYGEISPYATGHCDLHNQTMTLTVLSESPTPIARPAAVASVPPSVKALKVNGTAEVAKALKVNGAAEFEDAEVMVDTGASRALPAAAAGMKLSTFSYDLNAKKWSASTFPTMDSDRTLVLVFGAPSFVDQPQALKDLRRAYPKAQLLGCSSAGEIVGTTVRDNALSVAVARFERTTLLTALVEVSDPSQSLAAGQQLARKLDKPGLKGVLVLSEGLKVNGSQLVKGMNSVLPESVVVTGGLSGDGTAFKRTWVCLGDRIQSGMVAAVGFYGDYVVISHGSKGGWDKFGPERVVTRSEANVLYELDGKPALSLYKEYLGDKAGELPASGLLFPLAMRATLKDEKFLVRTLLAVDHEKNSMTFAGDVPKGHLVQLMKADFDRLIEGASQAAQSARSVSASVTGGALAVAISCVGRRLVLGDRTEEEVEAVMDVLPKGAQVTGFYSYGEISPYATGHCDLHNQTMTLTVLSESPTPIARPAAVASALSAAPISAPVPAPLMPASSSLHGVIEGTPESATNATETHLLPLSAKRPALLAPVSTPEPTVARFESTKASTARATGSPSGEPAVSRPPEKPATRIIALSGAASASTGITSDVSKVGDVQIIKLAGRMTEAFKGVELGKRLAGRVLFDLSGVERITSFGVREWLQMLREAEGRVSELYLARCSEPVVNQVSMIRGFSGKGRIVSFYAPYCCESCKNQFERLIDCEHDAAAISAGKAPPVACPRCASAAGFDDDPQSYLSFAAPHTAPAVPDEIRAILDEVERAADPSGGEAVEKTVDGRTTRLKVNCKLDASVRWNRILDGLEGQVVFDLGATPEVTADGAASFEAALSKLHDAEVIRVEGCPPRLVERMCASRPPSRAIIVSAIVDARCGPCGAVRTVMVNIKDNADALREGRDPIVPCKRCNTPLSFDDARPLLTLLGAPGKAPAPSPAPVIEALPPSPPAASPALAPVAGLITAPVAGLPVAPVPPSPRPRGAGVILAVLGVIAVGAVGLAAFRPERLSPAPAAAPTESAAAPAPKAGASPSPAASASAASVALSSAWSKSADLPPPWVERPFAIDGESVFVVGRGGPAANEEAALTMARSDAVERLASNMVPELMGSPVYDFLQLRALPDSGRAERQKETVDAVARRYLKQVGTIATPERVDAVLRQQGAGVEVVARYKLPKASFTAAVEAYRKTSSFLGITVGRFFPELEATIRTEGELIVVDTQKNWQVTQAGIRPGDVIIDINGRSVASVDAFEKVTADLSSGAPGSPINIQIESLGARRSVRFMTPKP